MLKFVSSLFRPTATLASTSGGFNDLSASTVKYRSEMGELWASRFVAIVDRR